MIKGKRLRALGVFSGVFTSLVAITAANAGSFGVREQSAYFQGMGFAGSAAGGDISSMFWNSAATASLDGTNFSSNATLVFGTSDINPTGGVFVTGVPGAVAGRGTASSDIGTDGFVPSSYATYQINDRLYAGLGLNAPFGFITKADSKTYAGAPIGVTSKVFSLDINPTLAYKLTPQLTVGIGAQIEYFKIRLNRQNFGTTPPLPAPIGAFREYAADDWGVGLTAGVIWKPTATTSIGLGYRSSVGVDVSGGFRRSASFTPPATVTPGVYADATGKLQLPDEVTLSIRQAVSNRLAVLGTVEYSNWSRIGNVRATAPNCPGGLCETLNLNYKDGWLFSGGVEYAFSPGLTLRAGVGYEISPIEDKTRSVLLPDSDRIHVNVGASYKYSDRITIDLAYTHLFFDDAPICVASPSTGSTNCATRTGPGAIFLGNADTSIDIVSAGLKYRMGEIRQELESYK